MARRLPLSAWSLLSAVLALGALAAWPVDRQWLDWQGLHGDWPYRAFTAAFVHWTPRHLAANLAGCAVLAWLGHTAQLGRRAALAWAVAWPLSVAALALRPEITAFGGLSGVLHAGVAVAVIELVLTRRGRERWIGLAIGIGLVLKIAGESPLGPALQQVEGWDGMPVVPLAHLAGAVLGAGLTVVFIGVSIGVRGYHRRRPA
ncbi:rhombosortase [Paucibacter sp. R3-3]|uniref:Rhombosortase n=1 Tax=Roseateles agri TaxID=3098619 RepID=A0ABU5DEA6_9BURK|nr:rhombosortase [Paucibacter sp. R3-3]MDY0744611.1 rhombosortase [Paucibacter sp. R3-3]